MRWKKTVTMVEAHAEGEVGRIVTGGLGRLPGDSILDTLNWLNTDGNDLRRFLVNEPRGAAQMSTCLLLPPRHPDAEAGFIVLQGDKAHAMSGSNTICLTTVLLETGQITMTEPVTRYTLDTASGLVEVEAECKDGKCVAVTLRPADCYAERLDEVVEVEGYGPVILDIAFGGIFYALVEARPLGLSITPDTARALVTAGSAIHRTVNRTLDIRHPDYPGLEGISYVMFTDRNDQGELVGATIMPPGRVDRSPCGTGNSARLAVMAARGEAGVGDSFCARSIINSRFDVSIAAITPRENHQGENHHGESHQGEGHPQKHPLVTPQIRGRGWIHGIHQIGVDPDDPYPHGFTVADCWGEAHDLVND